MARGINHVMLGIAREARGLTQSQLAAKLGVSQGTISKAENIPGCASGEIVDAYAKALSYPRSFFYQEHEYRHLPVVSYRKRKSVTAVEYRQIEAVANIMRTHLRAMASHAQLPDLVLPCVDLSRGMATPEEVARELRVRWHIPPGPIDNITTLMEDNGILVVPRDFGEVKIDGVSVWEPKDKIRPFVFVNHDAPPDRWRFTLAHELAHLILHHHLAFPSENCEGEADRFASEFLMPEKAVRGHLMKPTIPNLAALKARWKVSMQALIMKAGELETITPKQKSRLMIEMSSLGYRTREPVELPVERATLIHELFDYMVRERKLTASDIAKMLNLELEEMYQTYPVQRPQGLRLVRATVA